MRSNYLITCCSCRTLTALLFACFLSFFSVAQKRDPASVKREILAAENSGKEVDYTAYFSTIHVEEFRGKAEWIKSLEFLEKHCEENTPGKHAELCAGIGKRLIEEGNEKEAFYFLSKAKASLESSTSDNETFLTDFHESLGLSYLYFRRYDDARKQFFIVINRLKNDEQEQIGMLNTLGIINRQQGFADSSRIYFERALDIAKRKNQTPWIGILSGNLGNYYYTRGDYRKARALLERDYTTSLESNQLTSAVHALKQLIDIDLKQGKVADGREKLTTLEKHLEEKDYMISDYLALYSIRTSVLEREGKYKEALENYRMAVRYRDTISRNSDSENLKKTEFQIDFERKQAEVSLLKAKEKLNSYKVYVLIAFLVLVILVAWYLLKAASRRRMREKELASLRHAGVIRELDDTEKEMRKILSNLMEKNQLVEELTKEIEDFQSAGNEEQREEKERLLDRLQSFTLLTDDDLLVFKKLFEKLNPGFFAKVLSHFPDLTNAEIRLTALIKLNLSNLEMARVLGISPDSVRKSSLRLRKKLDMEQHEELVRFILSL